MAKRRQSVLEGGMAAVVDAVIPRFFTAAFLDRKPAAAQWARRTFLATAPEGYAGCCAAIRDLDQRGLLDRIRAPTFVLAGDRDVATPFAGHGDVLAEGIAGARVAILPAAHISALELPRTFARSIAEFLEPAVRDRLEAGFARRRSVLGGGHVDRARQSTTELTRSFQELITTYAWGTVWQRPGLDRRTRSLPVLAMTAALGRWEEFRLHLRAALDGGMEWCEVEEALLQVAIYAGVPAANTAFHLASEEREQRARLPVE
jgi:3-oxoadipate enol-lactonase/4-carboxymuconolactone decarboxylase